MEKAYAVKELGQMIVEEMKKDGLAVAEEAVEKLGKAVYFGLKKWAQESAKVSGSSVDNFIAPLYDFLDQLVIPQIEAIDFGGDKHEEVEVAKEEDAAKPTV